MSEANRERASFSWPWPRDRWRFARRAAQGRPAPLTLRFAPWFAISALPRFIDKIRVEKHEPERFWQLKIKDSGFACSFPQQFAQEVGQSVTVQTVLGDFDQGMVNRSGQIDTRPNSIELKEGQSCGHCRALVAIEEGLRLGNVKAVGRRDVVEVATTIPVNILGLGYGAFKQGAVTQTITAAMQFQRKSVEGLDLGSRQKDGLVTHWASLRKSSGCSSKTALAAAIAASSSA